MLTDERRATAWRELADQATADTAAVMASTTHAGGRPEREAAAQWEADLLGAAPPGVRAGLAAEAAAAEGLPEADRAVSAADGPDVSLLDLGGSGTETDAELEAEAG